MRREQQHTITTLLRPGARGFTLLEVLLAAAMGALIVIGAYIVYDHGQSTFTRTERRTDIQQNARAALDIMARQIRMAGYAALNDPNPVPNPIVIGAADLLVIRGDVRVKNPPLAFPGVDTIFGIRTDPNGDCPAPPCLMTHTPETAVTTAYTANAATLALAYGITGVRFRYFSKANVELLPLPLDNVGAGAYGPGMAPDPLPAPTDQRNAVARIQVTITAQDDPRAFAGPGAVPQTYALTQDIRIRNQN